MNYSVSAKISAARFHLCTSRKAQCRLRNSSTMLNLNHCPDEAMLKATVGIYSWTKYCDTLQQENSTTGDGLAYRTAKNYLPEHARLASVGVAITRAYGFSTFRPTHPTHFPSEVGN